MIFHDGCAAARDSAVAENSCRAGISWAQQSKVFSAVDHRKPTS